MNVCWRTELLQYGRTYPRNRANEGHMKGWPHGRDAGGGYGYESGSKSAGWLAPAGRLWERGRPRGAPSRSCGLMWPCPWNCIEFTIYLDRIIYRGLSGILKTHARAPQLGSFSLPAPENLFFEPSSFPQPTHNHGRVPRLRPLREAAAEAGQDVWCRWYVSPLF